ncbi:Retrovirus-related Pol polyprotein from transposon 297, partial [Araneus ventricosus]
MLLILYCVDPLKFVEGSR